MINITSIVIYYSYSHITKNLAEEISFLTSSDIEEITPLNPYSFSYNTAVKEVKLEIERGFCPKIYPLNLSSYDTVFIGSPNWLKTFAPPILTVLNTYDFANKTIIPFCTHGGGEFGNMIQNYSAACPNSKIHNGLALTANHDLDDVYKWLLENNLI